MAVRLAACVRAWRDVAGRAACHIGRTYWVAMTAAIVPEAGLFYQHVEPGACYALPGRSAGLTIATALFRDPHSLPCPAQVVLIAAFMFVMRLGGSRELWSAGNGAHRTRRADVSR